ncbi:MAG TPA: YraN family protein [Stellaceae bacterium]|jgi:putative endonuclease|nr:YraN family protein [Stellaceae bacterium]
MKGPSNIKLGRTRGRTAKRRAAERRGKSAELLCLWHLRLRGYRILARRYKTPMGEIDLIVRRGDTLAAIEVKARADFDSAGAAITRRQQQRIMRAIAHFLGGRPDLAMLAARFDVMLVAPRRWPRHLVDAWREE